MKLIIIQLIRMKNLLRRITFHSFLHIRINILWIFWYPRYYTKLKLIKSTLYQCIREDPDFSVRFPFLNYKNFKQQSRYWLHWIRKLDPREKLYFKEWNPILLIDEENSLHIDLSSNKMPILNYTFYFPDSEWIPQTIFISLSELKDYVINTDDDAVTLISKVNKIARAETMRRTKERIIKSGEEPVFISDETGIRLSPEFLRKQNK